MNIEPASLFNHYFHTITNALLTIMIEDEANLKKFKHTGNKVHLIPENKNYKPIITDNAVILGILSEVFRKY